MAGSVIISNILFHCVAYDYKLFLDKTHNVKMSLLSWRNYYRIILPMSESINQEMNWQINC